MDVAEGGNIHDTEKIEGGLVVLCFDLVFSVAFSLEIFLLMPLVELSISTSENRRIWYKLYCRKA